MIEAVIMVVSMTVPMSIAMIGGMTEAMNVVKMIRVMIATTVEIMMTEATDA
ncbi:hypothetical protein [Pseudomonas brassicacearum]|nr:hypothetical protein [Pseudomonas brassicacearum]